ncbi:MAG: hypothetical protein D6800_02520 [Candidatus Zixiibacteriota bacterium]|nr:MAG: hypothetical protein D6800_02520 [candidate division Zixibacteria bacterium]
MKRSLCLLIFLLLTVAADAGAVEFGFNVYGLSYHPARRDYYGRPFNEVNPGLGINVILHEGRHAILFSEGGSYDDSFHQHARYLSLGYKYKLLPFFSAGMNVGYYHSRSVNYNRPVLAPVPMASLRIKFVSANVVYMPSYWGLNWFPAWGGYLTFYFFNTKND